MTRPSRWLAVPALAFAVGLSARDGAATAPPASDPIYLGASTTLRFLRPTATPPASWRQPEFDDSGWAQGACPLGPLPPQSVTTAATAAATAIDSSEPLVSGQLAAATVDAGTAIGVPASAPVRVSALYVRMRFAAPGFERARGLRFTVTFQDGMAAWVNGTEIARVNLAPGAEADTPAEGTHGLDPQSFYVAIPPGLLRADGNLLAIEVHPFGRHAEPVLDVRLEGAEAPHIVRGPYLARVSTSAAAVVFDTDLPTPAAIEWGTSETYGQRALDDAGTHHVIELRSLPTDGEIHYRVMAGVSDSGDRAFHPLPPRGEPIRFAVFGDVRTGDTFHAQLVADVLHDAPDFDVVLGDLVGRGGDEGEWQRYFAIAEPLLATIPTFPAVGNHEYGPGGDLRFLDAFPMPGGSPEDGIYGFDAGDAHFAVLDSTRSSSPIQAAWLDEDLARARASGARALFVAMHAGPYSHGDHGPDAAAIRTLVPIFRKHRVAMIFSGHDHDFERGQAGALSYVVTGGGGAELYQQQCGRSKKCPGTPLFFASEHNYVYVELIGDHFRLCPRRLDGTPLEACTTYDLTGTPVRVAER